MLTLWSRSPATTAVFFGLAGVLGHGTHKIRTFALHSVPLGGKTMSELVLDQHPDVILTLIMKDLKGKEHRQKAEETREVRRGETSHLVTTATVTLCDTVHTLVHCTHSVTLYTLCDTVHCRLHT